MVSDLYPFKSNFLAIEGLHYHYLDEGQGDPLVMLHGNPTWSFYYRNLIMELRDSYRIIVPDHIGCGMSDKPDGTSYPFTLERRAGDLACLLEHLGVTRNITLVVHDWGGMIGFAYASRHQNAVERFVVMNTAAFHLPRSRNFPAVLQLFRNSPIGGFLIQRLNAFCLGSAAFCCTRRRLEPDVRAQYLAPYNTFGNRLAVLQFVKDIPLRPGDPSYGMVSEVQQSLAAFAEKPMLICWGLQDFIFDHHFLKEWIHHFPRAEVIRFDNGGHYILEDAFDEIASAVKSFLHKHPLGSAAHGL